MFPLRIFWILFILEYISTRSPASFHILQVWQQKRELPALDPLLHAANILVGRYAPQNAYEQALSTAESTSALAPLKVKLGPPFTSENSHSTNANASLLLDTGTSNENLEADPPFLPSENVSIKRPKILMETGFSPIAFFSCKI